jgi:hypothetical protein
MREDGPASDLQGRDRPSGCVMRCEAPGPPSNAFRRFANYSRLFSSVELLQRGLNLEKSCFDRSQFGVVECPSPRRAVNTKIYYPCVH